MWMLGSVLGRKLCLKHLLLRVWMQGDDDPILLRRRRPRRRPSRCGRNERGCRSGDGYLGFLGVEWRLITVAWDSASIYDGMAELGYLSSI